MTYRTDEDAAEARRQFEAARAKVRTSVLDRVQTASPCAMAWDDMVGDDQVRHCAACDKDVFNLSHMMREDAETLIAATSGKLCARYFRRADGTIMTADCAVGARHARRRKLVIAGVGLMVVAASALVYERTALSAAAEPQPAAVLDAIATTGEELATSVRAQGAEPAAPPAPPPPPHVVAKPERRHGDWTAGVMMVTSVELSE